MSTRVRWAASLALVLVLGLSPVLAQKSEDENERANLAQKQASEAQELENERGSGAPVITSATYDSGSQVLTIAGRNFSSRTSSVWLEMQPLTVIDSSRTLIHAVLPNAVPAGTYLLMVSKGPRLKSPAVFVISIGTTGPAGPTGPAGDVGPAGATGPQGEIGPSGPQGDIGPSGPQGPQGDIGPTGPQGPQGDIGPLGPQGPQGNIGPTGPQGPAGPAGANGTNGAPGATGIVSTQLLSGQIPSLLASASGAWAFAGPTVMVTIAAGQRITATATGLFGHTAAGTPMLNYTICAVLGAGNQPATNPLFPYPQQLATYLTAVMDADTAAVHSYSVAGSKNAWDLSGAGSYRVGLCTNQSAAINHNDFVAGFVMVTN